ncbi:hypothetical protein IIU_05745 [Bacillus cereus VD133]|uniref:Uncharacterized protein n=1 Tax=Bacillus cereus VD133 TaxID=1053233 RepID=A0A9W5PLF2_BACCE|nr:hypothetical protein [Bacillus cereus]EOO28627.1 hypothetical protein IIU_05745 [Bacillus cereus VD133]
MGENNREKPLTSIKVDVDMDTTCIQKKMKIIGEHALQVAQALQSIGQETNEKALTNYSTTELIDELREREVKLPSGEIHSFTCTEQFVIDGGLSIQIYKMRQE